MMIVSCMEEGAHISASQRKAVRLGLLLPIVLFLDTTEKSLSPSSLHFPFRYLYILMRLPQVSSLSEQLSQPFLTGGVLQSLCHLCDHWTLSSSSVSLLY